MASRRTPSVGSAAGPTRDADASSDGEGTRPNATTTKAVATTQSDAIETTSEPAGDELPGSPARSGAGALGEPRPIPSTRTSVIASERPLTATPRHDRR